MKTYKEFITEGSVATIIRDQIKTIDRMALMAWGAKNLVAGDNYLQFNVRGSKIKTGGMIKITLNGKDLYDIELFQRRGLNLNSKGLHNDIYAEDLVKIIDSLVG